MIFSNKSNKNKVIEPIKVQKLEPVQVHFDEKLQIIDASGHVSLYSYSRLIATFDRVEILLKEGRNVDFIFADTNFISLDALAFLIGNIEYIISIYGRNRINGTYSNSPLVNQFLIDSGFFQRIGAADKGGVDSEDKSRIAEKINLEFISGRFVNADSIDPLRRQVLDNNIQLKTASDKKIFRALSEAMLNVHHHAYTGVKYQVGRHSTIKGRWWLGGSFLKKDELLSFVMYDIGSGIPSTMPRNYHSFVETFTPKGETLDDAELILLATKRGKTSTKKGHRGRGIPDMHQIVENGNGHLQIVSGHGCYSFNGTFGTQALLPLGCRGTLVIWTIFTKSLQV